MEWGNYTYKEKLIWLAVLAWEALFWGFFFWVFFYMKNNVEAFQFEQEDWLYFLAIIPVYTLSFLLLLRWKNDRLNKLATSRLLSYLTIPVSSFKTFLKYFLFRNGLALLILALANPQYGKGTNKAKAEGVEIMICLDISNSMRALDLDRKRSRLDIAKMAVDQLLTKLHGDRIGLIVFAGDAFVQVPVTNDYRAARIFINSISPEMMTNQGTAIGTAIDKAMTSFDMQNGVDKAIIVMSDGEDHIGGTEEAVKRATENGIRISTVGVATIKESPIPDVQKGKIIGLKKDDAGKTVYTKLNEPMLMEIAEMGGGSYTRAEGTYINLAGVLEDIRTLEAKEIDSKSYVEYEDQYQILLFLGVLLLLVEMVISEKRSGLIHKIQEYHG